MKKIILIIFIIIILGLLGLLFWKNQKHSEPTIPETVASENPTQTETLQPINLKGAPVNKDESTKRPIAVIIENHPDARPQSGLQDADLVYEVLAEGGITRFLALYQTSEPKNIGPVRSLRPYFGDIANEWQAVLAHVGGSDEALEKISSNFWKSVSDVNEYYNEKTFQRVTTRYAPHNVYTNISKLKKLIADKNWQNSASLNYWKYLKTQPTSNNTALNFCLNFSLPDYKACYIYSPKTQEYARNLGGIAHKDANTNKQINVKNILVQYVEVRDIPNDPKLRIEINLTGEGKALLFSEGNVTKGYWKKSGDSSTIFYKENNEPMELSVGNTWVELLPNDTEERIIYN